MKTFDIKNIKAILFDSGKVLNEPISGHWFITPNFFKYVNKSEFDLISNSKKKIAFSKAGEYINKQNFILNESEEYKHFFCYYKIFFSYLPTLNLSDEQIKLITNDYVYNYDKYKFFDDVRNNIDKLSKRYKLAVVSDSWPSVENVFKKAKMREYFSSFVISSKKGVTKPHELMYKIALDELNILPEEAIFIDDNVKNCRGAMDLGIKSIVLCRDFKLYIYNKVINNNYIVKRNLTDISSMLLDK